MNVAILSMVAKKNVTRLVTIVNATGNTTDNRTTEEAKFNWSKAEQGYVLSSMFWGYIVSQVPGGYLAMRFSGVLVLGVSIMVPGVLSLFCPICATTSIWLLTAARALIGFFNGPMFPCANAIWARWAPPKEKSFIVGFVFSGTMVGTMIGNAISGIVCDKLGWESAFYIFGVISILWAIPWFACIRERPRKDRFCTESEITYIEATSNIPAKVKHPIKKILLSLPFYALCVASGSSDYGFYTLLTQYPTFLNTAWNYDVTNSGLFSALPYFFMMLVVNAGGLLSDWIIAKKYLRTVIIRKILFCSSMILQSLFILVAVFVKSATASVICMSIVISCTGLAWASYL